MQQSPKIRSLFTFKLVQQRDIPDLGLTLHHYTHSPSGAQYLHVEKKEDSNNLFAIGFPTPVHDSTGIPHILEHTTLCGSHSYPVRDPFFKMLNRSLATYMNAWTLNDCTLYPFATQVPQDFTHLRDIYIDAVFRPNLHKLDFLQEGWRIEKQQEGDSGKYEFKGVVFNEMKGGLSDTESLFSNRLQQALYPGSIYAHISGGDPLNIPELSYEQLKEFHTRFYNPSNAFILTYGNFELKEHLEYLNEKMSGAEEKTHNIDFITGLQRFRSPKSVTVKCPIDPMAAPQKQVKFSLAFLMNDVADIQESFNLKILSHLLLDGPSTPMHKVLLDSNIGSDYAPGTGYDTSAKIASFSVGLQGISKSDIEHVESKIMETFKDIAKKGFTRDQIDAAIHQIQLGIRHKSSNFGIRLVGSLMPTWIRKADPFASLSINTQIDNFYKEFNQGKLFERLISQYFLNNPHMLKFTMEPDADYTKDLEVAEKNVLQKIVNSLSEIDRYDIIENAKRLAEFQNQKEDISCLPSLKIGDIPTKQKQFNWVISDNIHTRTVETNGLAYFKHLALMAIPCNLLPYVSLFASSLSQLGSTQKPIEQFDADIKSKTGGISASPFISADITNIQQVNAGISISSYALTQNVEKMLHILFDAVYNTNFTDTNRLKTVLLNNASAVMNSIADGGHKFARAYAASKLLPYKLIQEEVSGITQAMFLNTLSTSAEGLEMTQIALKELSRLLLTQSSSRLAIISPGFQEQSNLMTSYLQRYPQTEFSSQSDPMTEVKGSSTFFHSHYNTNFAAKAILTISFDNPASPPLLVLAHLLRSKFLLREIREKGGAYGAGAVFSPMDGIFSFFSYRDPQPSKSLQKFDESVQWAYSAHLTESDITEAKLSIFSELDAPVDISSEGLAFFYYRLTDAQRQRYRDGLLEVTANQIKDVAARYLESNFHSAQVVIGNRIEDADPNEWIIKSLKTN